MVLSEDLARFPQESLHSFSFAHQSEESLHNRQNVLRRSIDFMKDKFNRAASVSELSHVRARLSGEEEVQSVMDLLQRADLPIPSRHKHPLETVPQRLPLESPVESVMPQFDSTRPFDTENPLALKHCYSPENLSPRSGAKKPAPFSEFVRAPTVDTSKRAYLDLDGDMLQSRLSDAIKRPGLDDARSCSATNISSDPAQATIDGDSYRRATHTHGARQHAAAQAIFTTDTSYPWTITAANDLACLVFGVSMAEVRKMGIMEVVCPESRHWLEAKLRRKEVDRHTRDDSVTTEDVLPRTNIVSPRMGTGVTAKLLSKPSSRQTLRMNQNVDVDDNASPRATNQSRTESHRPSRGVLLCGDVVPIQKRNGNRGSASLWVKEKQGGFIWVLEEIAEDSAIITVDEVGCVVKGTGSIEAIFGMERVRRGMDVKKLLPRLPKQLQTHTGALDYDAIAATRRYTARTANSINVPVTVDLVSDELAMKVSSFPHIAGIIVLDSDTLEIVSSNAVFSAALFGQEDPDGLHINTLIPLFDTLLGVISDQDSTELVDGIVIPEHSFRRARSLLAIRQGRADAASMFLRPSGVPARHRDGSEIMIDVQMRVLSSEVQHDFDLCAGSRWQQIPREPAKASYALWITYSREMHAVNHGIGPVSPLAMSRPGTPPRQPVPSQRPTPVPEEHPSDESSTSSEDLKSMTNRRSENAYKVDNVQPAMSRTDNELFEHPSPAAQAAGALTTAKKSISDFAILEEMGKGAYGEVKLVRYKRASAQKMVVKYVTKRRILVDTWTRDRRLGTVPLEIHVLDYLRRDDLQHRNIIEMADFFEDNLNYYIEMVPHGLPGVDLFDYIELRVNMDENECRHIFVQVACALNHLHNKARVVHRDIKDENVILDGQGAVKVVDFGSAAYIKNGPFDVFVGTIGESLMIVDYTWRNTDVKLDYAAPEVLRGSPYRGKEQDVWALGILLYTIVYKENPFYSIDEIMDHDLRVPYVMSEECLDLIRRMLDRDVDRRIGIQDVLEHNWCTMEEKPQVAHEITA